MDRRNFLVRSAQAVGFLSVGQMTRADDEKLLSPSAEYQGLFPITQAMTDATSSLFIIMLPKSGSYTYQVLDSQNTALEFENLRLEVRSHSPWAIQQLKVNNLNLGQSYVLQVLDESRKVLDERNFQSLNPLKTKARFAVASCMNDWYSSLRKSMWQTLGATNPDFLLLVGDSVYSDLSNSTKDEAGYWRRWTEARERLSYFRLKKLIPTFTIWDDHDFGLNNSDKNFSGKNMTLDLFKLFWGSESTSNLNLGPGVSKVLNISGQRIFLMDDRFYRDPKGGASHWGKLQEEFLLTEIKKSNQPVWIWSGSQFFGGYLEKESYEASHAQSFKWLMRELSLVEAPVCFGSGDVHFSETMLIEPELLGYPSLEFTSSAIHSFSFPGSQFRKKNPRRRASASAANFMVIESSFNSENDEWNILGESYGKNMKRLFYHRQTIKR